MRLLHETFASLATVGDLLTGGTWSADSVLTGLALDSAITYDGHQTLRYDPDVALGVPARLVHANTLGFRRQWARVVLTVHDTLYDSGAPSDGPGPVTVEASAPSGHTIRAGLWTPDAGDLTALARVATASETLEGTGETLTVAQVQALGWFAWTTLTEVTEDGSEVRIRGWRGDPAASTPLDRIGTLVLDVRVSPAVAVGDLTGWALGLDAFVGSASGNAVWLGEVTLWDAERDPDPYGWGYLFAYGFDDSNTNGYAPDHVFPYGVRNQTFTEGTAEHGHNYVLLAASGSTVGDGFLGLDLPQGAERELGAHGWYTPFGTDQHEEILAFRSGVATGTDRRGNQGYHCSLWHRTDGFLELRDAAGTVLSTSPTAIPFVDNFPFYTPAVHLYVQVGFDETAGWLRVRKDGADWWSVDGVATASAPGGCPSICWGHTRSNFGAGSYAQGWDSLILTRGVEYRLGVVEFLPPNTDGVNQWDVVYTYAGTVNGGVPAWYALYTNLTFEPDEDDLLGGTNPGSGLSMPGPFTTDEFAVGPSPLPDQGCGGLVAGVVPLATLRQHPDDTGIGPDYRMTVRVGGTVYPSVVVTGLRKTDPASQPYAGDNGFQTLCPVSFPLNPATGESWAPDALPEAGVRGASARLQCAMFGLQVLRVRPSNAGPTAEASGLWPRRNGQWQPTTALQVRRHGAWRAVSRLWQYRNGQWRPVAIAGSSATPPYCPGGSQPAAFVADLSQPLNTRIWSPALDTGGDVSVTGGELVLSGPTTFSAGGTSVDLFSNGAYDLSGGYVQAHLSQRVEAIAGRRQELVLLSESGLRVLFRFEIDTLSFRDGSGELASAVIGSEPRWWKIRHDDTLDRIVAETSSDGSTWTTFHATATGSVTADDMAAVFFGVSVVNTTSGAAASTDPGAFDHLSTSPLRHL